MNLPFVARGTYDLLLAQNERLEQRHAELVQSYSLLHDKLLGFLADSMKKPDPAKIPERTRDAVIEAIMARAGNDGRLRSCLSTWAMQQRRAQVPDDQIITQVFVWPSDDDSQDGML